MSQVAEELWNTALVLHRARMRVQWGDDDGWGRQKFPMTNEERRAYGHAPNPWVDVALAQAKEAHAHFSRQLTQASLFR